MPGITPLGQVAPLSIGDINTKIANLLGVNSGAVEINDMEVHPISHEVYISLSRIGNFASQPAIVKVTQDNQIQLVDLASLAVTKQALNEFPDQDTTFRVRGLIGAPASPRDISKGDIKLSSLAIMDMVFHDG